MPTESQSTRTQRLMAALDAAFAEAADAGRGDPKIVRAPSAVNLMGDHTEDNEGFVLTAAIDLETWIAFRRRGDGMVRTAMVGSSERGSFWIDDLEQASVAWSRVGALGRAVDSGLGAADHIVVDHDGAVPSDDRAGYATPSLTLDRWPDHVAGAAWSLREAAMPIRGFDGVIDSTIPPGIGGFACAALDLASALACLNGSAAIGAPVLASLAQRAELAYLGVEAGMADHLAAAAGREGRALLLDCRSLESRHVALPWGLRVVVCTTGLPGPAPREAELGAIRRAECGFAVARLAERLPWVHSLRDLDLTVLRRNRQLLPENAARRAEHVIGENARVKDAAGALERNDLDELCRLFAESHASSRALYEVGSPAQDVLVEVASAVPGVVAARMTGDGSRGGTINLVLEDAVPALVEAVEGEYRRRTGLAGKAYPVAVVDGAGPIVAGPG